MTLNQIVTFIKELESSDHTAVVFTPFELGELCPFELRDYLIEKGNEWIAMNKEDEQ